MDSNVNGTSCSLPSPDPESTDRAALSTAEVTDVLHQLLAARTASDHGYDPIQHVAVCGGRVAVHLAIQVSSATELAELGGADVPVFA